MFSKSAIRKSLRLKYLEKIDFGVAEWKYEFTFFDIIQEPFFAPLRLSWVKPLRV